MHLCIIAMSSVVELGEQCAYVVSISIVRSVSGFAVDVLKLGPFCTVNHCPFLNTRNQS